MSKKNNPDENPCGSVKDAESLNLGLTSEKAPLTADLIGGYGDMAGRSGKSNLASSGGLGSDAALADSLRSVREQVFLDPDDLETERRSRVFSTSVESALTRQQQTRAELDALKSKVQSTTTVFVPSVRASAHALAHVEEGGDEASVKAPPLEQTLPTAHSQRILTALKVLEGAESTAVQKYAAGLDRRKKNTSRRISHISDEVCDRKDISRVQRMDLLKHWKLCVSKYMPSVKIERSSKDAIIASELLHKFELDDCLNYIEFCVRYWDGISGKYKKPIAVPYLGVLLKYRETLYSCFTLYKELQVVVAESKQPIMMLNLNNVRYRNLKQQLAEYGVIV